MKIAIRGGHNFQATGCSGLIDETTEDRKVKDSVIKYLKQAGVEVLDVTPGNCDVETDLEYGVNTANNAKADLFASIHFNKAYDSYTGAIGSEVWLNPSNSNGVTIGTRILNNLVSLGFKKRSVENGYDGKHLFEVRNTNMTAMIVEVCFTEATEDVRIYQSVGYDKVGKVIAEGLIGQAINEVVPVQAAPVVHNVQPKPVQTSNVNQKVLAYQKAFNTLGLGTLDTDGILGTLTLGSVNKLPMATVGSKNAIVGWIQGIVGCGQDNDFGNITKSKVVTYQSNTHYLEVDGICGHQTINYMLTH